MQAEFWLSGMVHLLLLPSSINVGLQLLHSSNVDTTQRVSREFPGLHSPTGSASLVPLVLRLQLLGAIRSSGSPVCRQSLWDHPLSDHVSQSKNSPFIQIHTHIPLALSSNEPRLIHFPRHFCYFGHYQSVASLRFSSLPLCLDVLTVRLCILTLEYVCFPVRP